MSRISILPGTTSLASDEMWTAWADYNQDGNPIYLSQLDQGKWLTKIFAPGQLFADNFAPCPGIDRAGRIWIVWAGRIDKSFPGIYYSFRENNAWSKPRRVDESSTHWESTPTITFIREKNPVVAWSRMVGESTEIFYSNWKNGRFLPAVMISQSDGSPDSNPVLSPGCDGNPVVFWGGWKDGHSQIFQSRFINGFWSLEETIDPQPGIDQVLPSAQNSEEGQLSITWWENGNLITSVNGKLNTRKAYRDFRRQFASPGFTTPGSGAWILARNPEGSFEAYRYRTLISPHRRQNSSPLLQQSLATEYYIGYGDSITYGHKYGSDTKGWYGSILAGMLPTIYPGHSFFLYNEGYPSSKTADLLNGPGSDYYPCHGINSVINSHPLATKILIMGGTNDITNGVALSTTQYNLGQMIDRSRAKGVEPILATIIPVVENKSSITNHFSLSTNLSIDYIPPLASSKNCRLANPFYVFMQYYPTDYFYDDLYGDDYVHPRWQDGDQEIANAWFDAFNTPTPSPTPTPPILVIDSDDYNGDGTSDISIFRSSTGLWAIKDITRVYFGTQADIPVPGDYNNNGMTDIGIFRKSSGLWAIRGITRVYFGGSSDLSAPGDYNGDGFCDVAIFRESTGLWAVQGITRCYFGSEEDIAIPGYYQGLRKKEIAIFSPSSGLWACRSFTRFYYGSTDDRPAVADYDGDGSEESAIFRADSALWAIRGYSRIYYGSTSDTPVAAPYGGGAAVVAIFRENSGLWALRGLSRVYYGSKDDIPLNGRIPRPVTPTTTPSPTATPSPTPSMIPTPTPI